MDFERIPKTHLEDFSGFIHSIDGFHCFVDEFDIVGVCWSQPVSISASYFLRVLKEGSSARAHGNGRYNNGNESRDEYSLQFREYYAPLLDHGAMWKMSNGSVFCTAMPYGDRNSIQSRFDSMTKEFKYPDSVRMRFLDEKYRYRPNGDEMVMIYWDDADEVINEDISNEELYYKAVQHSRPSAMRYSSETNSFSRSQYVKEYARRRAKGICQLCDGPAPFADHDGQPYLEVHHIVWLAEGGSDSIDNTVALCPNCHRKMHHLDLPDDVLYLQHKASQHL